MIPLLHKYYIAVITITLLSINKVAAQPKASFNVAKINLGDITWNVPKVFKFSIRNSGDAPLQLKSVSTDCGCVVANWSAAPLAPGEKTEVTATFDAATLGSFDKSVYVVSNADNLQHRIHFTGRVRQKVIDLNKDFPAKYGNIRLSTDNIEFDYVKKGEQPQATVFVYNGGKKDYMPELMHLPKYLNAYAEPEIVRPGKTGKLIVALNSNAITSLGLTQTNIYLSRFNGDITGKNNEVNVSVTLLPHFTAGEIKSSTAPKAFIPGTIDLGSFKGKRKLNGELQLINRGGSPLIVSLLQVYNPGISVSLSKTTLKPTESAKLKIAVTANSNRFKGSRKILLITNDPTHPQITIQVETKN